MDSTLLTTRINPCGILHFVFLFCVLNVMLNKFEQINEAFLNWIYNLAEFAVHSVFWIVKCLPSFFFFTPAGEVYFEAFFSACCIFMLEETTCLWFGIRYRWQCFDVLRANSFSKIYQPPRFQAKICLKSSCKGALIFPLEKL